MATTTRFQKPNLTSLPKGLGVKIFKEILSSQKPDRERMHAESMRLEQQMKDQMEQHKDD